MTTTRQDYACGECGARYPHPGNCTQCDDPLLDLKDEEVRYMLVDDDLRRSNQRFQRLLFISIPVGFVLMIGLSWLGLWVVFSLIPLGLGHLAAAGLIALGLNSLLLRMFPAPKRFSDLV